MDPKIIGDMIAQHVIHSCVINGLAFITLLIYLKTLNTNWANEEYKSFAIFTIFVAGMTAQDLITYIRIKRSFND